MLNKSMSETQDQSTIEALTKKIRYEKFLKPVQYADLMIRYLNIALGKSDLSRLQGITLHNIVLNGGAATPTELSKMMYRSKHGMTNIVDGLEKKGQIIREHSQTDRRSINIRITKDGMESVRRDITDGKVWAEKPMDCLSDAERESLVNLTEKVYNNIKIIIDKMSYTKID